MTVADQYRLYVEMFGEERAKAQMRLQKLHSRKCICDPPSKRKLEGQVRVVHTRECPKFKEWMEEYLSDDS